jgi:uncharacterized protein (TIGR02996 family)
MKRAGKVGEDPEPELVPTEDASRHYADLVYQSLRESWRRVRDPAHERVYASEPTEPAFEAAVASGSEDAVLVFADWLQHRDHPRGALIALQHARSVRPLDPDLIAEEMALLTRHSDVLLGPAAPFLGNEREPGRDECKIELDWKNGFVRRLRFESPYEQCGVGEELLWQVLSHRSYRYVRELEIYCHDAGDGDTPRMAAMLTGFDPPPPLRSLLIEDPLTFTSLVDASRPIGSFAGLGARYPWLEEVTLECTGDVELDRLSLHRAHHFVLRTSSLRRTTLAAIIANDWPSLIELELWFGDDNGGCDVEPEDLEPLFSGDRFEHLRMLRLRNAMFSDELTARVLRWPRASALEELDFSLGTLSDVGAALLVGGREKLASLRRLNVSQCCLTPGGLAGLRDAGFPVVGEMQDQKSWRYVGVAR